MRIAIFGGTFDPIHLGHLLIAEAARDQFRLDRVVLLPAALPPHKSKPSGTPRQRLAMARAAVRGHADFRVSDWEVRQKKTVYTVDAIAHFRSVYANDTLFFIVGSDSLRDIPQWKTGPALLKACQFLVAPRPGVEWSQIPASLRRYVRKIISPTIGIASHDLRARVSKKQSIRYQVPRRVEEYIQAQNLYRKQPR